MKLEARCQSVKLLLSDVDGVLTDGGVIFDNQGIETKCFNVRDGLGIKLWQRAGYQFGVVSARASHIVKVRASELGVDFVRQGFEEKLPAVREIADSLELEMAQVAYIGDDLPDLQVIRSVGLGIAVNDAVGEVRSAAHYVATKGGGHGAVREAIETILRSQNRWDDLVRKFE